MHQGGRVVCPQCHGRPRRVPFHRCAVCNGQGEVTLRQERRFRSRVKHAARQALRIIELLPDIKKDP